MQSSKKSRASSRTVSLVLPATVGSSKRAGNKKTKRKDANTSSVPVALGPHPMVGKPNFSSAPGSDGRVRVRHREFVMDVLGSTSWFAHSLSINPAQPSAFPWLSALAQSYETYVFHTLRFEYMPAVGTSVNGVVLLAMDYDANDPSPVDKATFMQTHGAVRGSPWDYTVLTCDRPDLNKLPQHFTRKSQWVVGSGDLKTYDVGNLFIATHGQSAGTTIGELYVTYDVELRTPQPVIAMPEVYSAHITGAGADMLLAKPYGSVPTGLVENPSISYNGNAGSIDFKRIGKYLLSESFNLGTNNTQTTTSELVAAYPANGTATFDGRGYTGTTWMDESWLIDVEALPYTLVPHILNGAVSIAAAKLRLAPFSL